MTKNKNLKTLSSISVLCISLVIILFFHHPAVAQTPHHYTELEFPPLREIELPEYQRYQLNNGMVVYLMPDRELPLVSGTAIIRTGSRLEPPEKVGLAELVGTVMRSGGTQQHPPEELNQILEQRAATIETAITTSSGSASFNALSQDLDTIIPLFAQILRFPAFPTDKLELAKTQIRGTIARRNDDPQDIANREFQKLIYGHHSPYARTVENDSLDNISPEDIVHFYQKYFHPQQIILGIVGDFESSQIKQLIQEAFGDWAPGDTISDSIPTARQQHQSGIFFINQPQLTQSNILLGHLGDQLNNPDYPALTVINGILNGFGGRLFNQLRSRQGLAYSVYGMWSPRYDYPGIFIAGGQTRSDTTVAFIQSLLTEIEKLRTTPISEQELAYGKESILNSFVFNFQQPSQSLSRLMRYDYYNYPPNFLYQYQQGVKATTIEDVQRVAQKYLQRDRLLTLVVGNRQEIQPPLSNLGTEVQSIDISISQPQSS